AAGTTTHGVGGTMPILDALVDLERVRIAPRFVAGCLRPSVEVVLMPASPDHAVDARAAAEEPARRLVEGAMVHARAGLGAKAPVALAADVHEPGLGVQHLGAQVFAPGLQQKHLHGGILGESTGDDRTGSARADDDVVVGRLQPTTALGLIARDGQ